MASTLRVSESFDGHPIGFIPNTLSDDGDPLDVLVICLYPVSPGVVIRSRPVGVMYMTDEAGAYTKVIAVPHEKLAIRISVCSGSPSTM